MPTGAPDDPTNRVCAADVFDAVADMVNNPSTGITNELDVGGSNDPIFTVAQQVVITYETTLAQSGRLAAENAVRTQSMTLCAQQGNPNQAKYGGPPYDPPAN